MGDANYLKRRASDRDPLLPEGAGAEELRSLRMEWREPLNHLIAHTEKLLQKATSLQPGLAGDLRKLHQSSRALLHLVNRNRVPFPTERPRSGDRERNRLPEIPPNFHPPGEGDAPSARILLADDDPENREQLKRRLTAKGYEVATAVDGLTALEMASVGGYDLLLADMMMPGLNGIQLLERIRVDPALRNLPVIVISASHELDHVVKAIEMGAEDFLPKPCEPSLLHARIGATLRQKFALDREKLFYQALVQSQLALSSELSEAADYLKSLLPLPLQGAVSADWQYVPSTQLGGDALGYEWIDEDHFAFYLLDVCGHGIAAALHAISVLNVLRAGALPWVDFRDPVEVLTALNSHFPMEDHNNMYLTIWYGVFHKPTARLRFSNAGHPPALLQRAAAKDLESLVLPGPPLGVVAQPGFSVGEAFLSAGDRMLIVSDGVYEVDAGERGTLGFDDFKKILEERPADRMLHVDEILATMRRINRDLPMEDDMTLLRVSFDRGRATDATDGGGEPPAS